MGVMAAMEQAETMPSPEALEALSEFLGDKAAWAGVGMDAIHFRACARALASCAQQQRRLRHEAAVLERLAARLRGQ